MGATFEIEALSHRDKIRFEDVWISVWMGDDGFEALTALLSFKKTYSAVRLVWRARSAETIG